MEISKQLIEILDALCEKFGIAIDWTQSNILPYIEQLLNKFIQWEIATSIFWIVIMLFITLIAFLLARRVHKTYNKIKETVLVQVREDWKFATQLLWVIFGIIASISVLVIGTQIYDIITSCVFPEIMVFDKIQSLMSSGKNI